MARKCSNFLDTWMEYTAVLPTPTIFRKWAGLGALSCLLARRVWLSQPPLPTAYPNLYVLLVGPPGSGKDVAINPVNDLIKEANEYVGHGKTTYFGGKTISAKGLLERLACDDAKQALTYKKHDGSESTIHFQSVSIVLGELGTFLPEYDTRLISILNDVYNCPIDYEETIRDKGASITTIPLPHLSMLLGTQPSFLVTVIPDIAFEMGFPSRMNFVYADKNPKQPLRGARLNGKKPQPALWADLVMDAVDIKQMGGEMHTTHAFDELLNDFHMYGDEKFPGPSGSRFKDYANRRALHAMKLSMLLSAAESNSQLIEARHFAGAMEMLFEIEKEMPRIFENVISQRGTMKEMEAIVSLAAEDGKVTHRSIMMKLALTRPPHEANGIIEQMIRSGMLLPMEGVTPRMYQVAPN